MEYFKVQTNEGNGVLHITYRGEYLPYNYIVDNWQDIHNSWNVNIKRISDNKKDTKRSAVYIVSQYLAGQNSSYQRSSQSWKWLFRGYRSSFLNYLNGFYHNDFQNRYFKNKSEISFSDICSKWDELVYLRMKPPPPQQVLLNCG